MSDDEDHVEIEADPINDYGMIARLSPEVREVFEHAAHEQGVSIEQLMVNMIHDGFEKQAVDLAHQRGISLEVFRHEGQVKWEQNKARDDEILSALEWEEKR